LHLARALRHDEFVVSQLVAIGLDALACDAAELIAPGLRFKPNETSRPADPRAVRQLIAELLDEQFAWARFEASFRMDRVCAAEIYAAAGQQAWFLRPLADLEVVRMNRNFDVQIDAARFRDYPAAVAALARQRIERDNEQAFSLSFPSLKPVEPTPVVPRYSRWFNFGPNDLSRYIEQHFKVLAERRMTAVILAAQLYRADRGAWPAQSSDLVPAYLPRVPADPFAAGGRPLGYGLRKAKPPGGGTDRPVVYTHGLDLPELIKPVQLHGFQYVSPRTTNGQRPRQYRDLSPIPPSP
jgi:hypothetical protein